MTKKDYELIANGFKLALSTWTGDTAERRTAIYAIEDTALTIASQLQAENPRFDKQRFLTACGIKD